LPTPGNRRGRNVVPDPDGWFGGGIDRDTVEPQGNDAAITPQDSIEAALGGRRGHWDRDVWHCRLCFQRAPFTGGKENAAVEYCGRLPEQGGGRRRRFHGKYLT
jgi:hypothetical protein